MSIKIVAIGTGRDGTTSLTMMLNQLFLLNGSEERAYQEWKVVECFNLFAEYRETLNNGCLEQFKDLISRCPWSTIVGNGYGFFLPQIHQVFGSDIKLIHLKRRDRNACIDSLISNSHRFPEFHGYYSDDSTPVLKRTTAVHFEEMSQTEWESLSLREKFAWYYDKTHQCIESYRSLFKQTLLIYTEELNEKETHLELKNFVNSDFQFTSTAVQANAFHHFIDYEQLPEPYQRKIQGLFSGFDFSLISLKKDYCYRYFSDRFFSLLEQWLSQEVFNHSQLQKRFWMTLLLAKEILQKLIENLLLQYNGHSPISYKLPLENEFDFKLSTSHFLKHDAQNQPVILDLFKEFNLKTAVENDVYALNYFTDKLLLQEHEIIQIESLLKSAINNYQQLRSLLKQLPHEIVRFLQGTALFPLAPLGFSFMLTIIDRNIEREQLFNILEAYYSHTSTIALVFILLDESMLNQIDDMVEKLERSYVIEKDIQIVLSDNWRDNAVYLEECQLYFHLWNDCHLEWLSRALLWNKQTVYFGESFQGLQLLRNDLLVNDSSNLKHILKKFN